MDSELRSKMINRETFPKEDAPHGWIQWKGTHVCMDIYCKCGHTSHIDDEFAYYIKCPKCNTVYKSNGNIELMELNKEELEGMNESEKSCIKMDESKELE